MISLSIVRALIIWNKLLKGTFFCILLLSLFWKKKMVLIKKEPQIYKHKIWQYLLISSTCHIISQIYILQYIFLQLQASNIELQFLELPICSVLLVFCCENFFILWKCFLFPSSGRKHYLYYSILKYHVVFYHAGGKKNTKSLPNIYYNIFKC